MYFMSELQRMAQTTEWLPATFSAFYKRGDVEHTNVFFFKL